MRDEQLTRNYEQVNLNTHNKILGATVVDTIEKVKEFKDEKEMDR